ncbi:unnamed protein product [Cuscuta europaea]|uniref:Uncharacterized protein n=1 Tax=Cuscuta europaea TaxID=41803 RepID=A0A9P0Z4X9_CUSEU|nr:unnamed protein product [Cuscuta europaea]
MKLLASFSLFMIVNKYGPNYSPSSQNISTSLQEYPCMTIYIYTFFSSLVQVMEARCKIFSSPLVIFYNSGIGYGAGSTMDYSEEFHTFLNIKLLCRVMEIRMCTLHMGEDSHSEIRKHQKESISQLFLWCFFLCSRRSKDWQILRARRNLVVVE